jgi:CRISPR-associated protein Csm3
MDLDLEFKGKYIITGKIICETGLHIGGTIEGFEIGGVENIVVRDPLTEWPYIPGSSLKGKLRHLLEWSLDKVFPNNKGEFPTHSCENDPRIVKLKEELKNLQGEEKKKKEKEIEDKLNSLMIECPICLIFGSSAASTGVTPTRLTVRDAFPTEDTLKKWRVSLGEEVYTEVKTENAIDRVTSQANPRPLERVPAGSEFAFEMVFDVYKDTDKQLLQSLFTAMHLLENSALGGSGTRGSGKVKFADIKMVFRPKDYYFNKTDEQTVLETERIPKPSELKIGERPEKFSVTTSNPTDPTKTPYENSLPKFIASLIEKI